MVGAVVVHARAGDLRPGAVPPAVLALVCVLDAWLVQSFVS